MRWDEMGWDRMGWDGVEQAWGWGCWVGGGRWEVWVWRVACGVSVV